MPMVPTGWSFCIIIGDYSVYASSLTGPNPIIRPVTGIHQDFLPVLAWEDVPLVVREKATEIVNVCQEFAAVLNKGAT